MARNDGIDRTFARNQDLPTLDDVAKVQEHNEREKDSYSNQDIDTTQTYRNIHFKAPTDSYAAITAKANQRTAHRRLNRTGNPLHGEKDDHRQYHSDPIRVQHTQGLCGQWDSCQGRKQPFGGKTETSAKERRCLETAI